MLSVTVATYRWVFFFKHMNMFVCFFFRHGHVSNAICKQLLRVGAP